MNVGNVGSQKTEDRKTGSPKSESRVRRESGEIMTRDQVAEMLSVDVRTVDNMVRRKVLKKYGLGSLQRFKRDEILGSMVEL